MKKQAFAAALLSMLLILALVGVQLGNLAYAQSYEIAVLINADGNLNTTAPITRNGDVYTLIEDLQGSITVQKSNLILDGANHTVEWIQLENVNNVTVINFTITNPTGDPSTPSGFGIGSDQTTNSVIENNTISQKKYGIISSSLACSRIRIAGNTLTGNQYAVHVEGNDYDIIRNNITANGLGIYLYLGFNSVVSENQIAENGIGMRFFVGYYGHIGDSNLLYFNNFVNNSRNVENVGPLFGGPNGPTNDWHLFGVGNYWSDYSGIDANGDGIGDTPYIIDALNQDDFPLIYPFNGSVVVPVPTPSPSPSPSLSPTPPPSPSPSPMPSASPTPSPSPSPSPSPTTTPTPSPSWTPTPNPHLSPSPTATFPSIASDSFPTTLVTAASLTVAAAVSIGLLVYFKKRKR